MRVTATVRLTATLRVKRVRCRELPHERSESHPSLRMVWFQAPA